MSFLCCGSSSTPSRSKRAEAEAEIRRARIVPVLNPPSPVYAPQYRRRRTLSTGHPGDELPPPRYEDISGTVTLSGAVSVTEDEKNSSAVSNTVQSSQTNATPQQPSEQSTQERVASALTAHFHHLETSSDRSSIISIPSTQVTGLDSTYTGTTTLHGGRTGPYSLAESASMRRSEDRSSGRQTLVDEEGYMAVRPPSYYATTPARGSRSSSPGDTSGSEGDSVWRHPVMRADWFENLRGTRQEGEWRR